MTWLSRLGLAVAIAGACLAQACTPALADNIKISAMPAASALTGTEMIPAVQSGANVQLTPTQVKAFVTASPTLTGIVTIATSSTPASSTAACTQGQVTYDASYIYVCVATSTWKRSALSSW